MRRIYPFVLSFRSLVWLLHWLGLCCFGTVLVSRTLPAQDDGPLGITVQLPTLGVSIDAAGVLSTKLYPDVGGKLVQARLRAAHRQLNPTLQVRSNRRMISLRGLEEAIKAKLDAGEQLTDAMQSLAGLTRVEYVFVVPENQDIVLAGPAEPWIQNPSGRSVGIFSGQPILLLDDLVAALRTYSKPKNANAWVACSIDPTAQGIQQLKRYQKQMPKRISQSERGTLADRFAEGIRDSLGLADVKVYGIEARSHMAQVMVEADYRMKLMAVGLEPPPVAITTFLDALKGAPKQFQRWWLIPDYKCLTQSADRLAAQLNGRGVKLQTQNVDFGPQARIQTSNIKPSRAAQRYADSFTQNYVGLAAARPVFAQLRNVIDLLVAQAWLRHVDAFKRVGWTPKLLLDETQLPIARLPKVKHAQCVANAVWKGNVLVLPAGGGVSISASRALKASNLRIESEKKIHKTRQSILLKKQHTWWWD